jgi:hypothetical protein
MQPCLQRRGLHNHSCAFLLQTAPAVTFVLYPAASVTCEDDNHLLTTAPGAATHLKSELYATYYSVVTLLSLAGNSGMKAHFRSSRSTHSPSQPPQSPPAVALLSDYAQSPSHATHYICVTFLSLTGGRLCQRPERDEALLQAPQGLSLLPTLITCVVAFLSYQVDGCDCDLSEMKPYFRHSKAYPSHTH